MKNILLLAALAASLYAQDAQVIQLSDADAHAASDAYQSLKAAQDKWSAVKEEITKKYIAPRIQEFAGQIFQFTYPAKASPWSNGFEFSPQFQFIVPVQAKPEPMPSWGSGTVYPVQAKPAPIPCNALPAPLVCSGPAWALTK
jgi:hypothetical protein